MPSVLEGMRGVLIFSRTISVQVMETASDGVKFSDVTIYFLADSSR